MTEHFHNPEPAAIKDLLGRVKTIAVVGLSAQPSRPSHKVALAMQRFGFRIVPVRPGVNEVLGEKAYARLSDIPFPVDLADVFRAAEFLPGIVEEVLQLAIPALWIQEGIVNEAAACRARERGIFTVMDRCIWKEYVALQP
ncbi:MAG: CoA-binding protein [Thiobacillaceae bacterium]